MNNEAWYPDKNGKHGPLPEGLPVSTEELLNQGFDLNLLLIDYHYNYWRLRKHIAELEGKVYALEETLSGQAPDLSLTRRVDE